MDYTFEVILASPLPLVMDTSPRSWNVSPAYAAHHDQQIVIQLVLLRFPHYLRAHHPAPAYLGAPFDVAGLK